MTEALDALIAAAQRTTMGASPLRDLLSEALTSGLIMEVLQETASDDERLDIFASRSYRHPNGFVKLALRGEDEFGPALRVHFWQIETPQDHDVHDHSWHFASYVVSGSLTATEFHISQDGSDSAPWQLRLVGSRRQPGVEHRGNVRLLTGVTRTYVAGDIYAWDIGRLHGPEMSAPGTITIVLQGAHQVANTRVISKRPQPDVYSPTALSASIFLDYLSVAIEKLPAVTKR
jgi:hypothetical protein